MFSCTPVKVQLLYWVWVVDFFLQSSEVCVFVRILHLATVGDFSSKSNPWKFRGSRGKASKCSLHEQESDISASVLPALLPGCRNLSEITPERGYLLSLIWNHLGYQNIKSSVVKGTSRDLLIDVILQSFLWGTTPTILTFKQSYKSPK